MIEKGTIVIQGNRIQAVGANVSVPSGAKPVDAGGATVIPGFIDASTDIGLNEPGVRNYDDVSEMLPFNQMLRTRVAYQSDSVAIPVARVEGITTVGVRPGGGIDQRRSAGDESRRLDVGRSDAASGGRARLELPGRGAADAAAAVAAAAAAPRRRPAPIRSRR